MKVIVTIEYDKRLTKMIRVRKCPPEYKVRDKDYQEEFILELQDYTKEDIKEYFSNDKKIWMSTQSIDVLTSLTQDRKKGVNT